MMMMGNNSQQQQQQQHQQQHDRRDQHLHAQQQNQQAGKQQTPSHDTKRPATAPRLSLSRSISYSTPLPQPTYSPANAPANTPLPVPPSAALPSDDPQHLQQQFVHGLGISFAGDGGPSPDSPYGMTRYVSSGGTPQFPNVRGGSTSPSPSVWSTSDQEKTPTALTGFIPRLHKYAYSLLPRQRE
jgi:hypothetical protein